MPPPSEFTRHVPGTVYVLLLARLVAATQQDHHHVVSHRSLTPPPTALWSPKLPSSTRSMRMAIRAWARLSRNPFSQRRKVSLLITLVVQEMYPKGDGVRQARRDAGAGRGGRRGGRGDGQPAQRRPRHPQPWPVPAVWAHQTAKRFCARTFRPVEADQADRALRHCDSKPVMRSRYHAQAQAVAATLPESSGRVTERPTRDRR